jgi:riboflavin biosynthesis pyrimidine reductase
MVCSVDGRTLPEKWHYPEVAGLFEKTAAKIDVDAWLVGRTTMQEFSSRKTRSPRKSTARMPKKDFVAPTGRKTFAVAIDPEGKCHWDTNAVDTEHVIEVLTERVSSAYLAQLRAVNVSYIFGGRRELDLRVVLQKLNRLFGIRRVRIDGGGTVNGSFLAAGLIDELSLVVIPVADGTAGSRTVFDVPDDNPKRVASRMKLQSVRRLKNDAIWLRYAMK